MITIERWTWEIVMLAWAVILMNMTVFMISNPSRERSVNRPSIIETTTVISVTMLIVMFLVAVMARS